MDAVASDAWTARTTPLAHLLGKRTAAQLERLGLHTAEDLALDFPFRYTRRGELMPIAGVREGEAVTVVARVLDASMRPMHQRRGFILNVSVTDGTQTLELTFFGRNPRPLKFHESRLQPGVIATFSGTVGSYRGELQLTHPDYELVEEPGAVDAERLAQPIGIYHGTEKLPSWKVAKAVATVLPTLSAQDFPDPLPATYRADHELPELFEAICTLHRPESDDAWQRAQRRFKHEEAFVLQAALATRAEQAKARAATAFPVHPGGLVDRFDAALPFTLTAGQRRVGAEISDDLASTRPMQRLLQGDVGSGKTVVALRAMLQVLDGGGQAALLAPTEVLAYQHLDTIRKLLGPLEWGAGPDGVRVEILTGSLAASQRRTTLAHLAGGTPAIVVGTHALLSDAVQLPYLGLAVIDEQHRFGVDQRAQFSRGAHTLVMTATPIPRTIAMSAFGDLDVSTLTELPAGRTGVTTTIVPAFKRAWMDRVWERAAEEVRGGSRVFVVCPRISADRGLEQGSNTLVGDAASDSASGVLFDDADAASLASVEGVSGFLRTLPALAGIGVGVLHGRMSAEEKTAQMERFVSGVEPVLVSTTVIEVGVDVPDATLMVIMDADFFGLSQLHQLRGRIGRGVKPGLCLAVTRSAASTLAGQRLAAFVATADGFKLAEKDLELRSEGDVLGSSQSGTGSHLHFLSVRKDEEIIATAREAARTLVGADPALASQPALAKAVARLDTERAEYMEKD